MYTHLADKTKHINKLLSSHLSPRSQSNLIDSANFHYSNSQAKLTIEHHSDPPPHLNSSSRTLLVKKDGKSYLKTLLMDTLVGFPMVSLVV